MTFETISKTVEALRGQPSMLVVILMNILFLAAAGYFLEGVSSANERHDALIRNLIMQCFSATPGG